MTKKLFFYFCICFFVMQPLISCGEIKQSSNRYQPQFYKDFQIKRYGTILEYIVWRIQHSG